MDIGTLCEKIWTSTVHFIKKQYFPRAQSEERKYLETGLTAVGANSSLVVGGRGEEWALETLVKMACNQIRRPKKPFESFYNIFASYIMYVHLFDSKRKDMF